MGDVRHRAGDKLKRITVFLNPAARNGRGRKTFDKNVAPILHLAGFEVRLIKTEREQEAKDYMAVLEEGIDAIVVAGGGGTLSEVVTGLLRRPDADTFSKIPIGFIPMGYTNTVAQSLFYRGRSDAEWQFEAAMAVVKGFTQTKDVMQISNEANRSVYMLSKLEKGVMTDIKKRKQKNWYMGGLKHRWAYIRESLFNWPRVLEGELKYTDPCSGCSTCYVPPPKIPWKWWHVFLPPQRAEVKDYSNVINENCGKVHTESVSTMQLDVELAKDEKNETTVLVSLAPKEMARTEFIQQGWELEAKKLDGIHEKKILAGEVDFLPKVTEGKEEFFMLDSEQFEVGPVKVKVQKDKINMYRSEPGKPFIALEEKDSVLSLSPINLLKARLQQ